jgi:hypothetical protein
MPPSPLRREDDGGAVADGDACHVVIGGVPGLTLFAEYVDDRDTTNRSHRDGKIRKFLLAQPAAGRIP